ncbi:phosphatidylinositol-glycan-specific phospholipase D-like isoform X2 [Patiria miniata]|uniref:Phosphatidylinositol-glycan-specific phospholipase D n=1 Tax=Patiria miniata TaxID=46514 RepID=A0A913ZID9_PATMI|nr:phosphatidylinositol-glycan-specific phospholipase D-like isoform X2 [Patiria miniata]
MALLFVTILFGINLGVVRGCGTTTHIEIGHRATEYFEDQTGGVDYKKLILDNQDAFQGGNPYPDAFYPNICEGGKFHQVSEDTHWVPFLNATINYIRRVYPKPWDKETEKLVVFMLGFASHQVADVSWHSLGIDQGFLRTMGDVNFHGSFDDAHSVGDIGGDIVATFEFDLSYIDSLSDWYIPTKDLVGIYKDLYGRERVNSSLIEECTALLFLERLGEKLAISKLFPDYAAKSPFMEEQFQSYFLGGLDDMATWTTNVWHEAIYMLDKGTSVCSLPRNPIYINCNGTSTAATMPKSDPDVSKLSGLHINVDLHGLTPDLVDKQQTGRGVYFSPSEKLKMLHKKRTAALKATQSRSKSDSAHSSSYLKSTFTTRNSYAHLGWSLVTADVNVDKIDDLIIGAPGYGITGNPQNGRVFIVFGREESLPEQLDIDTSANLTLSVTDKKNGHFGTAVAVLDFNQDGLPDLAVSAPSTGSASLNYTGAVYVYLAKSAGVFPPTPSFTITCKLKYCNLGWSLATADLNHDGYRDLIIGSPFVATRQGQQQSGALWVVYSKKAKPVRRVLSIETEGTILLEGDQQYGWLGYDLVTKAKMQGQGSWLLVSQPAVRICAESTCAFSSNDIQSVGRLLVYDTLDLTQPLVNITGRENFGKLGSSFGIGDPYDNGEDILGVGADTTNVKGKIIDVPITFTQAGNVNFLSLKSAGDGIKKKLGSFKFAPRTESEMLALLEGDRSLARFGASLLMEDVTNDGVDDVVIGAPLRIDDITEELYGGEQGAVYVFKGSKSFPRGNVTRQCNLLHKEVEPCPGNKAIAVLSISESGGRFGHRMVSWKNGKMTSLVVAAPRSSKGGRLAGSVLVYSGFN